MKNLILLILLSFVMASNAKAQLNFVEMAEDISRPELPDSLEEYGAVYLNFDMSLDFRYGESGLTVYKTEHKRVLINDEEAINRFNTYYVGDEVIEWVKIEARTIDKDGKVVNFDKSSIKEIVDEESGDKYKAFAVDGIKEGDIVEYLTIKQVGASSFGQLTLQKSYPVIRGSYSVSCPENLQYALKPYNVEDYEYDYEMVDSIRHYTLVLSDISPYKTESFSYESPNKIRVEYRLNKNSAQGEYVLNSWDKAASNIYNFTYGISAKEEKAIENIIKELNVSGSKEILIKQLEDRLKKEILVKESAGAEYNDIAFLLDKQIASHRGITKLYANVLKKLGVEHEIVLTCSRRDYRFDKDFQNWNRLDDYLIYFPDFDKYITPSWANIRFGPTPAVFSYQYALFAKKVRIGEFESAIAEIRFIPAAKASDNYDHIYTDLRLSEDFETVHLISERAFKGSSGAHYIYYMEQLEETVRNDMLKELTSLDSYGPEVKSLEVLDKSQRNTAEDADFVFSVEADLSDFVELANDNILLKLGNAIGPQSELYSEGVREHDVENHYNRTYYRELQLKVPEGYVVSNPESAKMEVYDIEGTDTICAFISTVDYDGDVLKVVIDEYYNEIYLSKESYEPFRKVVNAAADFNKVVIILKPE